MSEPGEPRVPFYLIRVKRRLEDDPLDSLGRHLIRQESSIDVIVLPMNSKAGQDEGVCVFKLMKRENDESASYSLAINSSVPTQYTPTPIVQEDSADKTVVSGPALFDELPKIRILPNQSQRQSILEGVLENGRGRSREEFDAESLAIDLMQSFDVAGGKPAAFTYIYDYYVRSETLASLSNLSLASTGFIDMAEIEFASDVSEDDHAEGKEDDSNAESYYRNDYPDEDWDDEDGDSGLDHYSRPSTSDSDSDYF